LPLTPGLLRRLLLFARDDTLTGVRRANCIFLLLLGPGILAGCDGPKAYVREGDAESVELSYAGDVASTLPVARAHCARFERVPRLVQNSIDLAEYDCVRR
jgi:hypothetical protein